VLGDSAHNLSPDFYLPLRAQEAPVTVRAGYLWSDESVMRQQGTLADWNDDRGFGSITPVAGGPRVFVYVSAFPRGRRPAANDLVTYGAGRDQRNRLSASDVLYVIPTRSVRTVTRGLRVALVTSTLFFALLVGLVALGRAPVLLLAPYYLFSVVGFAMYRVDKLAAERGAWRTSEASLHAIALLGGWPGALVARRVFRHKTSKQPFRTIFWVTVIANCVALAWLRFNTPALLGLWTELTHAGAR
jgi:uncharacterized membrane protein YsdA (DUF1294 family)/cold shock CspA family protein